MVIHDIFMIFLPLQHPIIFPVFLLRLKNLSSTNFIVFPSSISFTYSSLLGLSLNSTDPVLNINNRYRRFTPREVARIQSFHEDYFLTGSESVQYKGLGNAIPPVLMWHVAKSIVKCLKDVRNVENKNHLYQQLEITFDNV